MAYRWCHKFGKLNQYTNSYNTRHETAVSFSIKKWHLKTSAENQDQKSKILINDDSNKIEGLFSDSTDNKIVGT